MPREVATTTESLEQTRLLPGLDPDDLIAQAKERWSPLRTFCMFSGGNDSGVLAHRCRDHYDALFYIDTGLALPGVEGTDIPGVEDFVRSYAQWIGKPLVIKRSTDAYRTMVLGDDRWWERYRSEGHSLSLAEFRDRDEATHGIKEGTTPSGLDLGYYPWGFPGIGMHGKAYSRLKERRIEGLVRDTKAGQSRSANVLFLSGIRRDESDRRSSYQPLTERWSAKFVNPLIDWSSGEMSRYREEHDIPESDIAALLHRSGECNCAARGTWWEERAFIKSLWPNWFEQTIESVEREAEARGVRWCVWGGFDLEGNRAGEKSDEQVGLLCSNCPSIDGQMEIGV